MDAPTRFSGESSFSYGSNQKPKEAKEKKIEFVEENPSARIKAQERLKKLHPERVCTECSKLGLTKYLETTEWRHVKDDKGKVIEKDANGKEIWLCNTHGLKQDRALRKAQKVAEDSIVTKKRMSVESVMNPTSKEEEEIHIRKKMSVDSLLDDRKKNG